MPSKNYPYQNPELTSEQRADDLLGHMTRAEKIGQLNQCLLRSNNVDEMKDKARRGELGSILTAGPARGENVFPARVINELQKAAVEESRLGIPLLNGRDVIHGYRTIFPIPLGLAASFDPQLVEDGFAAAAREAVTGGVNWSFAPMIDIARDPRWGRIIEGFGEDPYLCSRLAEAAVRGFQGSDLSEPGRLAACAKHFIGYGASEGGRDYDTTEISENTLRNIYLPPYRAAVEAGAATVMSSFQDLNGEPLSGSKRLLTGLLKDELGFDGFIISDWESVREIAHHRAAEDERDAARVGMNAGVDMDMVSELYLKYLDELIEAGKVSEERLNDAARRILVVKFRLGLFERPYTDESLADKVQLSADHRALARKAAARCMVLLKNEGDLLPLANCEQRVAVIGPLANERAALLGAWTFDGKPEEAQTILEALKEALPEADVRSAPGSLADEMLVEAAGADTVILVVGESGQRNGENANVASLKLPAGQEELARAVCALGKPVALVVVAGRPLDLLAASQQAQAILWAWQPGTMGAAALADVLLGEVEPGGRLPITFPRATGQVPIYYNFKSSGKVFDRNHWPVPEGYRHFDRYVDISSQPLYPFGFGLGYTTFEYSNLQVSSPSLKEGETVRVAASVTNTGKRAGETVVQLYAQDVAASVTRPVRELKGFQRAALQPGETRRVEFELGFEELSFYNADGQRVVEPGRFKVWAGGDCRTSLEGEFRVE